MLDGLAALPSTLRRRIDANIFKPELRSDAEAVNGIRLPRTLLLLFLCFATITAALLCWRSIQAPRSECRPTSRMPLLAPFNTRDGRERLKNAITDEFVG